MTPEDKKLILQDLCARLPYGVICDIYNDTCTIKEKLLIGGLSHFCDDTIAVRPYLRPMSSMTEEEKLDYTSIDNRAYCCPQDFAHIPATDRIDWLNAHHFDYRGLIEKNLALDCTGLHIYD